MERSTLPGKVGDPPVVLAQIMATCCPVNLRLTVSLEGCLPISTDIVRRVLFGSS